jgi:cell division protein FtsL
MHINSFWHLVWFLVLAFGRFLVSLFGCFLLCVPVVFFSKYKTGSLVTQKEDQESKLKPANNDFDLSKGIS